MKKIYKTSLKMLGILYLLASGLTTKAQTFTSYSTADGLVDDNVSSVDVDATGKMWFGTNKGISTFDGSSWTSFTTSTDTGLISNAIKCLKVASNGDVWVGSTTGASKFDGSIWTKYTTSNGLGDNRINSIDEGPNGSIWFGDNDGFTVFDSSKWSSYTTSDGLPFGGIVSIDFDSKGEAWLGAGLGGLIHFDGTTFTEYKKADGLISNLVRAVLVDDQDNKWVATAEGVSVLDASNTKHTLHHRIFELPAPDTLNPVVDLAMDSHKRIWAGVYVDYLVTEGGISMLEAGKWTDFDKNDGLAGPVVRALVVDSDNNVWVATSSGVTKVSAVPVSVATVPISNVKLYPNPSTNWVQIETDENFEQMKIEVRNAMGELVHEEVSEKQNIRLELNMKPGVYFVELTSDSGAKARIKLIKSAMD